MKPDKTFWIIFTIVILIVAIATYPKGSDRSLMVGKCFIAYSSVEGDSILKITAVDSEKIFGSIEDKKTKNIISGKFSKKEIQDLKEISCP